MPSFRMCRRVALVRTYVSEEFTAYNISVRSINEVESQQ
jgi:hypothetical protein